MSSTAAVGAEPPDRESVSDRLVAAANTRTGRWLTPILFAVPVLVLWQLVTMVTDIPESSLPSPVQVVQALWDERDVLAANAIVTAQEILIGFAASIVFGVALAVMIHSSKIMERGVYPWLVISQMIPIPAIAPIIVIWTGFDIRPKIIVIVLICFFPIAVNTIDGLRAVDPDLIRLLKTLRASRRQLVTKAELPAALPFFFSGLKIAAAFSVIGAVFAEWVGSSEGLGYLILVYNNSTQTAEMFACIVLLSLTGVALFTIIGLIERLVLPWYHEARRLEDQTDGLRCARQPRALDPEALEAGGPLGPEA